MLGAKDEAMNEKNNLKIRVQISDGNKSVALELESAQKVMSEFFEGLVPDFIKDGFGIVGDQVAWWRFRNQVGIVKKAKELIAASGLKKKQIPMKVLERILNKSSLEEDVAMQEKWANLLANVATGKIEVSPNYPAILDELSPIEVKILDDVFNEASKELDYQKRKTMQFSSIKLQEKFGMNEKKVDLIIEDMYRLNLFQSPYGRGISQGGSYVALRTTKTFEFTTLGYEFVRACRWEDK